MVNYLIFAGILYSKQIKLPTLVAIEPEPKTLARQTVSEAKHQTKQYCCQLKKSVHISVMKASKLVVELHGSIYNILYISPKVKITIHTYCDVCYGINSVVYR